MRKATLIYNPLAGTLHLDPVIDVVADFWREHGWEVQIQPTRYAGHARSLARKAVQSGNELVLAAGGDGTLGEIAGGLADSETVMAPLPAGTGNSFTRELMLAKPGFLRRRTLVDACAKLIEGQVQHIDLGCYNGDERWLLWAGAGVDSYVIAHIEPRSRFARRLGGIGYLGLGTPFLSRFPGVEATVTVDGSTFQDNYLMVIVSNCRRYAGGKFLLSPDASLDDGLFEVWMFKGRAGWGIYRYLAFMAIGRHLNHPDTLMVKGRDITIETQPSIPFQRDGDPAGSTPMRCWVKPESLRLLVPQEVSPTLFSKPGELFDR